MISNAADRAKIASAIGPALDDLVRERMKGLVGEPDITSRVGQRLEDRFDGEELAGYRIRVISETITSHGPKSLENPMGSDLYFAISVEDAAGNETTKGILVQAKREDKRKWRELEEQCRRMELITKKGSVVWLYRPSGIGVLRASDVAQRVTPSITTTAFFDQVLKCTIGDRRKVPGGDFGDRDKLKQMLETLGARNAVWLDLEKK